MLDRLRSMFMGKPPEAPKQEAPAPKREIKPNEVPAGMTPFEAAGLTAEQPRMSNAPDVSLNEDANQELFEKQAAALNAVIEAEEESKKTA